ncbi:MAG TPA: site-2 protease family protein [Candidatus Paceibacterota bacterium]|nr:site-2 protease family protein [Candidatus Paceibacterota bacterium]
MDITADVFIIVIVIFSAIIHEVMHGVAADYLGDKTARYAGRLTLNPIPHIDPFGSILLPLLLALSGSPIFFGWAKPVPYNPYNLRPGRFSEAIVAGAGPASNLVIALIFGAIVRFQVLGPTVNTALFLVVVINVMLCIFNLIPIPPLDGSKVLEALLPRSWQYGYSRWRRSMEMNPFIGMVLVVIIILLLGGAFSNLIYAVASGIAGFSL